MTDFDPDQICHCRAGSGRICDVCLRARQRVVAERLQQLDAQTTGTAPAEKGKPR